MKRTILAAALLLAALAVSAVTTAEAKEAPRPAAPVAAPQQATCDVVLIHGWRGNASDWDSSRPAYAAQGCNVHAPQLPTDYGQPGDIITNARFVQQYLTDHGLTSVRFDSHSAGGATALLIAFAWNDPRVTSVVLRDTSRPTGFGCWAVPDLCSNSDVWDAIDAVAPGDPIPVLHLAGDADPIPQVDCLKVYSGYSHDRFQTAAVFGQVAAAWPGTSPCAPSPTPTPTPTPSPTPTPTCSWWQRLWRLC